MFDQISETPRSMNQNTTAKATDEVNFGKTRRGELILNTCEPGCDSLLACSNDAHIGGFEVISPDRVAGHDTLPGGGSRLRKP
jgi:hypothetical protein